MTESTDCLDSHPRFHCTVGLLTLAYTPRRSDQVSVKQEFCRIVLLCHGNAQLSLSFVSCLSNLDCILSVVNSKGSFLPVPNSCQEES